MVTKDLKVLNAHGIHARPAALIVETCCRFRSRIIFVKDGMQANAKSIMNIMMLAAEFGAVVRVEAEGEDEIQALEAVERLFLDRFGRE